MLALIALAHADDLCREVRFGQPTVAEVEALLVDADLDATCGGALYSGRLEWIDGKTARSSGSNKVTAVHVVFPPLLFAALFGSGGPSGELPALSWSILYGELDHVRLLLEAGADPNTPDSLGLTPVYWALTESAEHLQLVLDAGGDPATLPPMKADGVLAAMHHPQLAPHACPAWPRDALDTASWRTDTVALAGLAACPSVDPHQLGRATAITLQRGGLGATQQLLADGASLEHALEHAASRGWTPVVEVLLDWDADPDGVDGTVPLNAAVANGRWETADLLLRRGAALDHAPNGVTTLSQRAWWGDVAGVTWLIEQGADPSLGDPVHRTLTAPEKREGRGDAVVAMIEAGAEITPATEAWAYQWFRCGPVHRALVERGLPVTREALDDLMYMCPEDEFVWYAEQASVWDRRRVWLTNRDTPNGPVLREMLRD